MEFFSEVTAHPLRLNNTKTNFYRRTFMSVPPRHSLDMNF